MAFVVDGSEWSFDGWTSANVEAALERFVSNLARARTRNEVVLLGDDLQIRSVYKGLDLWRLREPESEITIDPEVWQELAAELGRLHMYADEEDWPDGFADDVAISINGNQPQDNPDVAWAHHRVRGGQAMACIGLISVGQKQTASSLGAVPLHWMGDAKSQREFWRSAIDIEGNNPQAFERHAESAYPDIYFCTGVLHHVDHHLDGGYFANAGLLRRYLDAFNDYGAWAMTARPPGLEPVDFGQFVTGTPSRQIIERRFTRLGLTVSPENPNVFEDKTCREAREVDVGGNVLYCEWHGKLEAFRNRIHIHPPVPQSDNRLVVSEIVDHLPLP